MRQIREMARAGAVLRTCGVLVLAMTAVAAPAVASVSQQEGFEVFPCLEGWSAWGQPLSFTPGNLYTYIDGEAELYLPYHLEQALFIDYIRTGEPSRVLNAELFKFGSPLDAFGIYSYYRRKDAAVADIGAEAMVGSTQLVFYKGNCLGRITVSDKTEDSTAAMLSYGREMAEAIPGDTRLLPELEALRIEGVVPRTERYVAKDLMELPFFKRGLTAEANVAGETARVFVVLGASPEDAAAMVSCYEEHIKQHGTEIRWREGDLPRIGLVPDPKLKGTAICQDGRNVVGVCLLKNPAEGLPLLRKLLRSVSAHLGQDVPKQGCEGSSTGSKPE